MSFGVGAFSELPFSAQLEEAAAEVDISGAVTEDGADVAAGTVTAEHDVSGTVTEGQDVAAGTLDSEHDISGTVAEDGADTAAGTLTLEIDVSGTVTEDGADVAAGTVAVVDDSVYVSGDVTEDGADTAAGTLLGQSDVSGAVTEDGTDTAAGTLTLELDVSGTVTEDGADTAAGTLLNSSDVSGTVTEDGQDSASGTLTNPDAIAPVTEQPAGRPSKSRRTKDKRRRVIVDGELYDVPERDIPALLEAKLLNRRPPSTAEVVEDAQPRKKASSARKESSAEQPALPIAWALPTVDETQARYEAMLGEINAQAQVDVARLLDRVAQRVLLEIEDDEDAAMALLFA